MTDSQQSGCTQTIKCIRDPKRKIIIVRSKNQYFKLDRRFNKDAVYNKLGPLLTSKGHDFHLKHYSYYIEVHISQDAFNSFGNQC